MAKRSIGLYIKSLRLQKGLTQKELAKQLYVTDKAVSKWERELSFPDILLLPKLAEVLDVSVGELIRETGSSELPDRLLKQYKSTSDLRAPLHIILGCADLLEMYRDDEEKFDRYMKAIRISGRYLISVFDKEMADGENGTLEELLEKQKMKQMNTVHAYDFTGKRILVAEDIAVNREIVGEVLKKTGASMEFAEDGQVCVDLIAEKPAGYFDMILMDIMMPRIDGVEATKQIRGMEDSAKAGIPIIAMTANTTEKDRNEAFEAGMDAFTEKPFIIDKLLYTMRQYL